jgi:site-specific recombinase XerD
MNEMKTHKSALRIRAKGDKKRCVKTVRPTIRQINVTLRRIRDGLRIAKRMLRSPEVGNQLLARQQLSELYQRRVNIDQYFRNIANA